MPPDFLNSREDALLVWSVVLLAYVLSKDPRGIGGSLLGVLRALLAPKLVLLFGSALAYSAGLVYLAWWLGAWHTAALKETIYWFSGTGVILVGQAVMASPKDPEFARRVLHRVVGVTVLIEFAANIYAFPLGVELVLVFVASLFVMLQAVAPYVPSMIPSLRTFIDHVVVTIGLLYLVYFVVRALTDLDGFLTRENAEELLVGPALTVALVPVMYASRGAPAGSRRTSASGSERGSTQRRRTTTAPGRSAHTEPASADLRGPARARVRRRAGRPDHPLEHHESRAQARRGRGRVR